MAGLSTHQVETSRCGIISICYIISGIWKMLIFRMCLQCHSWNLQAGFWRYQRQGWRILGNTPAWPPMQLAKLSSTYDSMFMVTMHKAFPSSSYFSLLSQLCKSLILHSVGPGYGIFTPTICMCNFLCESQSLPTSHTRETSSTKPSWLVFPLSLNAKPQEVHYPVISIESPILPQNPCFFYSFIF